MKFQADLREIRGRCSRSIWMGAWYASHQIPEPARFSFGKSVQDGIFLYLVFDGVSGAEYWFTVDGRFLCVIPDSCVSP